MEGRDRWGRRVEEGAPGRCKNRILQGIQKGAGPNAAMDKANRNKMFLQGEREQCGKDKLTKSSIKTLMAIAWVKI